MKIGKLALHAGTALALWGMLGLGLGLFDVGTARAADGATANAFVRLVEAAPVDDKHVDVFTDNSANALLSGFTFSNVTDYMPLAAGTHTIQVVPTGQGKANAVINQSLDLQAGAFYTVAITGTTDTQLSLVTFTDGVTVPTDKADLRVYHLSPDAGPLSVSAGGKTFIDRLTYKSASGYLTFNINQSIFDVTLLDKTSNRTSRLDATFEPNRVSSVFVLGLTSIIDSLGFKFVTKLTAAVPTALPPTGFAPVSSSDNGILGTAYMLVGLAALALLGGTRLARARRLPAIGRGKLPHPIPPTAPDCPVGAIPDHSRGVKTSGE